MPHDNSGASVRCPYYKSHTRTSLICEWIGGSLLTQRFSSSQRRIRYIRKYCSAWDFGRCPFAAVMNCTHAPWLRPGAPPLDPAQGSETPPPPVAEMGGVEETSETSGGSGSEPARRLSRRNTPLENPHIGENQKDDEGFPAEKGEKTDEVP